MTDTDVSGPGPDFTTRLLDGVAALCMTLCGILLVILIVIFGWLVFGRYVLNATPTWAEQAALLIVVWITFLGAAVGVRRRTHLAIDFIRESFPPMPRAALKLAALLMMAAFGGFMAWQGWGLASSTTQRMIPLLGIAESWRYAPVVVAGGLILAFTLDDIARLRRGAD